MRSTDYQWRQWGLTYPAAVVELAKYLNDNRAAKTLPWDRQPDQIKAQRILEADQLFRIGGTS